MLEESHSTPDQTAQPAPSAQTPQSTTGEGLQGTVDQQSLGGSGQSIDVQSSAQQAQPISEPAYEQSTLAGFDISTGLLFVVFAFATSMILLLAWLAMRHEKNTRLATAAEGAEANGQNSPDAPASVATPAPPRRTKKPTKRQRRKQQR